MTTLTLKQQNFLSVLEQNNYDVLRTMSIFGSTISEDDVKKVIDFDVKNLLAE
jgi:hypothetical protein